MPAFPLHVIGLLWAVLAGSSAWLAWTYTPLLLNLADLDDFRIPAGIVAMMLALTCAELIHAGLRHGYSLRNKTLRP